MADPSLPPQAASFETGLDPSFIIRLILQILPVQYQQLSNQSQYHPEQISNFLRPSSTARPEPPASQGSAADGLASHNGIQSHESPAPETSSPASDENPDDQQEAAGCMLWDLSADPGHAQNLVDHYILDVIAKILPDASQHTTTGRLAELLVGILGNLVCHPGEPPPPRNMFSAK